MMSSMSVAGMRETVDRGGVLTHPTSEFQRLRCEIWRGSRFGDRSRQIRLRLRQTLQRLWPRDMERLRSKCAMLGLLDCTAKLTSPQDENVSIWIRGSNLVLPERSIVTNKDAGQCERPCRSDASAREYSTNRPSDCTCFAGARVLILWRMSA